MALPAKYPPQVTPASWNAMCNFFDGFTPAGTFISNYSFVISTDGTDISASNAFQTIYGGSGDEGAIEGDDANAYTVFQKCIDIVNAASGGDIYVKKATYIFTTSLVPKSNVHFIFESGTVLKWAGAVGSNVIANTARPLINFCTDGNVTVDVNNVATTNAVVFDTIQKCHFKGVWTLKNIPTGTALKVLAAGGAVLPDGASNSYKSSFDAIHIEDAQYGISFQGNEASVEITLLDFNKVWMERITSKGIAFKGWASGIHTTTCWIWLSAAGATGVLWNDSATPLVNVGDYDNTFINLKVDPFGAADNATTTLLKFNCTKEDYVYGFFHSGATTFLGTVLDDDATTVSYYVVQTDASQDERAATKDAYIRVLSKGFMHGTQIFDKLLVYGDAAGTGASVSLNDLKETTDCIIYFNTKIVAAEHQAKIWFPTADANLRIVAATGKSLLMTLGDATGATYYQIKDSADALRFQVDSDGNTYAEGYIKTNDTFRSSDDSQGATADIAVAKVGGGTRTLTFKDGLYISYADS